MTGVNTANGAKVKADRQGVARAVFCFILCFSVKQCFVNENHTRLVSQKHTRAVWSVDQFVNSGLRDCRAAVTPT